MRQLLLNGLVVLILATAPWIWASCVKEEGELVRYVIRGRVVSEDEGLPLDSVRVSFSKPRPGWRVRYELVAETLTDSNGRYELIFEMGYNSGELRFWNLKSDKLFTDEELAVNFGNLRELEMEDVDLMPLGYIRLVYQPDSGTARADTFRTTTYFTSELGEHSRLTKWIRDSIFPQPNITELRGNVKYRILTQYIEGEEVVNTVSDSVFLPKWKLIEHVIKF